MADERCDFSDLPASACGCQHCRPDLAPPPPTVQRVVTTMVAQFATRCPDCDGSIREGDPIALLDRDGWVHEECVVAEGHR